MSSIIILQEPHLVRRLEQCAESQGVTVDKLVEAVLARCEDLKIIDTIMSPVDMDSPEGARR